MVQYNHVMAPSGSSFSDLNQSYLHISQFKKVLFMIYLILGLVVFFAGHLVRIVAPQWRVNTIASIGEKKWKGLYSVASLAGLALLIWGFTQARPDAPDLFTPPDWGSHVALSLMAIAFILMMAGNLPTGKIKQAVKHPFVTSVKIWALVHLLVNGDLASAILFVSFLAFAIISRIAAKRRGEEDPVAISSTSDLIAIVSGLVIWALVAFWLHEWAIGVNPIA
jgi:uncharacterized membrane protein